MSTTESRDLNALEQGRARIRATSLRPAWKRRASTARALHHTAPVSSDVQTAVHFLPAVLGGLHHVAISVDPQPWPASVERLTEAVEHEVHSCVCAYFRDPDGARIELIADPLGEMYGQQVL